MLPWQVRVNVTMTSKSQCYHDNNWESMLPLQQLILPGTSSKTRPFPELPCQHHPCPCTFPWTCLLWSSAATSWLRNRHQYHTLHMLLLDTGVFNLTLVRRFEVSDGKLNANLFTVVFLQFLNNKCNKLKIYLTWIVCVEGSIEKITSLLSQHTIVNTTRTSISF